MSVLLFVCVQDMVHPWDVGAVSRDVGLRMRSRGDVYILAGS